MTGTGSAAHTKRKARPIQQTRVQEVLAWDAKHNAACCADQSMRVFVQSLGCWLHHESALYACAPPCCVCCSTRHQPSAMQCGCWVLAWLAATLLEVR